MVLVVCSALGVLAGQDHRWLSVIALGVLAVNAAASLLFWTLRLRIRRDGSRIGTVLAVGLLARVLGLAGLAILGVLLVAMIGWPSWLSERGLWPEPRFWIFWGWAVLEIVQAHVYKLTLGTRDTLEHVLRGGHWAEADKPLRGAIGQQLRKLRQR